MSKECERQPNRQAGGRRGVRAGALALGAAFGLAVGLGLLPGCGGSAGVGSNGTGSPLAAGLSVGTVTGLGSVIVDGVRHDDSQASVEVSRGGDDRELAEVRLGQRVSLEFTPGANGASVLGRIELAPSLVGIVNERTDDTVSVLGQTVVANDDPTRGPVTVFAAPYTRLADIALGDAVEIHAVRITGPAGSTSRLMATRIDKRSALTDVRVTGIVTAPVDVAGGGQRFMLGPLAVIVPVEARVLPEGSRLQAGRVVTVFAAPEGFDRVGQALTARRVVVASVGEAGAEGPNRLTRAGLVADWSSTGFSLDGVPMRLSGSTQILPAGRTLGNGMYVRVDASLDATTGDWVATRIESAPGLVGAELHGNVMNWSSASRSFKVRDTRVTLNAQTRIDLSRCTVASLTDGLYVSVTGTTGPAGVSAATVSCEPEPKDPGARLERSGVVVGVDLTARRLRLQVRPGEILDMAWNSSTFLRPPLSAAALIALIGAPTIVEAELAFDANGALVVRNIHLRGD